MFVWGSKSGVADLGAQASRHCPVCERERSFRLLLQYKVSHLWYIIKWVSDKQYAIVCEVCQRGEKLVTQAVEARLGRPNIPTASGRGWMFVVGAIATLAVVGFFGHSRQSERTSELLASVQKADIYVVNVSSMLKSPQALGMYGLLRVRSVQGDRVEFDTPAVAYDKAEGAKKDLRNGKVADPAYFNGEPVVLTRGELAALRKSGALDSILRP